MRQVDIISLLPRNTATVHLVVDDFGTLGRAYRETDERAADATTVVENLLSGQYFNPLRVIAFNLEEGWVRDASEEVARSLLERARKERKPLPDGVRRFVDHHVVQLAYW
jgi:hypothetical protein